MNDATKRAKPGIRCYSCGSEGHLQKQCPVKNKGGPRETPGQGPPHASRKVAKLSSKEERCQDKRQLQTCVVNYKKRS